MNWKSFEKTILPTKNTSASAKLKDTCPVLIQFEVSVLLKSSCLPTQACLELRAVDHNQL